MIGHIFFHVGVVITLTAVVLWSMEGSRERRPRRAPPTNGKVSEAAPAMPLSSDDTDADALTARVAASDHEDGYDWRYAHRSQLREPVHITSTEDVRAWGERVRAEISAWAQQLDPSPSPPITENAPGPVTPARMHKRRLPGWIALPALALAVLGACLAAFHFLVGWPATARAALPARAPSVTHHLSHGTPAAPAPKTATPGPVAVRTLAPASAAAFGPAGGGQGDNTDLARLAIDGNPATAWHTDWYASAHFGKLYPGTGLLVDMGRPVTITAAQLTLGPARGASFQLRVGAAPALADLRPVAHTAGAGGVVRLRLSAPALGRYVLIWFTSLPPDRAGTFQVSVYNVRLQGRS